MAKRWVKRAVGFGIWAALGFGGYKAYKALSPAPKSTKTAVVRVEKKEETKDKKSMSKEMKSNLFSKLVRKVEESEDKILSLYSIDKWTRGKMLKMIRVLRAKLVPKLHGKFRGKKDVELFISVINEYLKRNGFRFVNYNVKSLEEAFRKKYFDCDTYSLFVYFLGKSMGLDVRVGFVPGHAYLAFNTGKGWYFYDGMKYKWKVVIRRKPDIGNLRIFLADDELITEYVYLMNGFKLDWAKKKFLDENSVLSRLWIIGDILEKEEKNIEDKIKIAEQTVKQYPDDFMALANLAEAYKQLGEIEKAKIKLYESLILYYDYMKNLDVAISNRKPYADGIHIVDLAATLFSWDEIKRYSERFRPDFKYFLYGMKYLKEGNKKMAKYYFRLAKKNTIYVMDHRFFDKLIKQL